MFCSYCGYEARDTDRFCAQCGHGLFEKAEEYPRGTELDFSIKPVFFPALSLLRTLPLALFFMVWGGLVFGGVARVILDAAEYQLQQPCQPFLFAGLFCFILVMLWPVLVKKSYEATVYRFYPDRIEYCESFLNQDMKMLMYNKIIGVSLRKSLFQRMFHTGSIYVETASSIGFFPIPLFGSRRGWGSGIFIKDVENPDEVYQKIKKKSMKGT